MSFQNLGLSEALVHGVQRMGYVDPSPIQLRAIPLILCDDLAFETFCFLSGALLSGDPRERHLVGYTDVPICQKLLNRRLMVRPENIEGRLAAAKVLGFG